ncbi:MAG: helix-turn-helix domain-containing protein [Chitinophagales bacterium]|nr:helix-turn-helix domain-containing protein [Chitinophagales bacterium]
MIDKIRTKRQYEQVLELIEGFIKKANEKGGFKNLSKKENDELKKLSLLAEEYEDNILKIMPLPVTLENVVTIKMKELNITQAKLAKMLNIGTPKLSQILNGKRKPDVTFLKAVHKKLGVDGNFILENI